MLALVQIVTAFHLLVGGPTTEGLLERFKPTPVNSMVSLRELRQYARARICTTNIDNHVGILQQSSGVMNLYICKYEESVLTIESCVWGLQDLDRSFAFSCLLQWFGKADSCGVVVCGNIIGQDREACLLHGGIF